MKKLLSSILAAVTLFSMAVPAFAGELNGDEAAPAFMIVVGEQPLDLSGLPCAPYKDGGTVMVPLRRISEALGYQAGWDPKTGAITIEDEYIQKATLHDGTATVVFEGKLKIINMSREIENAVKTVIHNGSTYVPLEFFQEFLNDTAIEGTTITIAPSMCEATA